MNIKVIENYFGKYQQKIIQRTLILDIHRRKEEGRLVGDTPEEQYAYYCEQLLGDKNYREALYAEFPELERLLRLDEERTRSATDEILRHLAADREEIISLFCGGSTFRTAESIVFTGDSHRGGKRAARVLLDNGTVIYYKPHSLGISKRYQEIYAYLCEKAGTTGRRVSCISHANYGWEENIENKSCNTKEAVERYYDGDGNSTDKISNENRWQKLFFSGSYRFSPFQ